MDDLDKLSNNELRQYMLQCGFPNTPITDTTRKILIKRLKNHLNKKKTILKKQVSSITRFSSDEESDIDQNNRNEVDSSAFRRKTYYPSSSNSNSTSGLTNNNYSPSKILNNIQNSTYFNSRFSSPSITSTSTTTSSLNNNNTSYEKYKISPTSRIYVSPTYHYQDNKTTYQNNNETYDASDYSDAEYNSNSSYNNNLKSSSNFTRRLLSLRNETLANSKPQPKLQNNTEQNIYYNNNSHHNVPLVNLHSGLSRRSYYKDKRNSNISSDYDTNALSPSTAFKNVLASLNEHFAVQQHFIPCLLVSVAIIFFVSLSFLYINITPNLISTVTEKSVQVNYCQSPTTTTHSISSTINLNQNSISCIYKNQINDALEIIKFLIPILQEKSQHYYCKDRSEEFTLNSRNAINMVFENISKNGKVTPDIRKITLDMHNAEYIIEMNPQWQVSHVNKFGESLSFSEVVKLRNTKENYYAMLNPSLPLLCSIHNKLEKFFILIGSLAIALIVGGTSLMLYRIFVNYRTNRQRSVFNLIEEIINSLINKAEKNPNDKSVVVNHLRDMLIPVHKRKELDWAWNKAIHYLRQNESRVVFEMGIVNGEDCEMIKWIDTVLKDHNFSSSLSENRKSSAIKRWESPAFNDKTNKIKNPPTPCLKIRQMFDKSEANDSHLEQVIHDAILEKVGLNCKIYDIQIDKQSCCVYVRCASESDAGIVHDEINGWWFDKRLVSIKFLRLERYLARFPNSYAGPKCLYPSNSKKLSISNVSMNVNNFDDDDDDDNDTDEEQT